MLFLKTMDTKKTKLPLKAPTTIGQNIRGNLFNRASGEIEDIAIALRSSNMLSYPLDFRPISLCHTLTK